MGRSCCHTGSIARDRLAAAGCRWSLTVQASVQELGLHDPLVCDGAVFPHKFLHLATEALLVLGMFGKEGGGEAEGAGGGVVASDQEESALCHQSFLTKHWTSKPARSHQTPNNKNNYSQKIDYLQLTDGSLGFVYLRFHFL